MKRDSRDCTIDDAVAPRLGRGRPGDDRHEERDTLCRLDVVDPVDRTAAGVDRALLREHAHALDRARHDPVEHREPRGLEPHRCGGGAARDAGAVARPGSRPHAPQQASPDLRKTTPPSTQVFPPSERQQHMTRSPSTTGTAYAIQNGSAATVLHERPERPFETGRAVVPRHLGVIDPDLCRSGRRCDQACEDEGVRVICRSAPSGNRARPWNA